MATASLALTLGFWVLPPVMLALLLAAVSVASKRAGLEPAAVRARLLGVGLAAGGFWLLSVGLAAAGAVRFGSLPPRPVLLFLVGFGLTVALARSRVGTDLARHLPIALLVGVQSFRIPVELLLHRGALDGLTPPQMTYTGLNFDIVTGLLAVPLAFALERGRVGAQAARAFNILGSLLLANVVCIAILSMPTPLRLFWNDPPNVWISSAPFIALPTTLVPVALLGHLLLWKRLRDDARAAESTARSTAAC